MLTNGNVGQGTTTTYTFDGIGFNTLRPYMNNVYFRQAMAWLTDYSYIQTTVLSGVAGTAGIGVLPCAIYPGACYTGSPTYNVNNVATEALYAYQDMIKAGLHPGNLSDVITLGQIPDWFVGPTDTNQPGCTSNTTASACVFSPLFWYRADDPLRTLAATSLCADAVLEIGLHINCQGSYGSGGHIYGPAAEAVTHPGVYNSTTGGNNAPTWDSSAVNGTGAIDVWDMYTFGWITSANYVWAAEFFNSQFAGTSVNFGNYNNQTINILSNDLLYATSMSAAQSAASSLAFDLQQQLPYLMFFYQNTLWAVYLNGWTGFANVPTTGPDTGGGLYYTLLNVQPTNNPNGGTFNLALHAVADTGGMNPLYNTNWVWQADIYSEIYDGLLGTYPSQYNVVNAYFNWMTTGNGSAVTQWVQPFTGTTGTGPGWFQMQGAQGVANKITNGQVVTFNLRHNMTWTDNVPVTAYDYNFSLYAWGITLPPTMPDTDTPISGLMAGSAGLWATYINPANPYQIQLYVNSSSVWNLANTLVLVLPQHIFNNFNVDLLSTASGAVDITQPLNSSAVQACDCVLHAPTWLEYLPNLMVGTGPFYLATYNGITGAGELIKNPNYQRTAWKVIAALPANTIVATATTFAFSTTIQEFTYNPTGSAVTFGGDYGSLGTGGTGYIGITNATASIQLYNSTGTEVGTPITTGITQTNGVYTVSIPTSSLTPGAYEIVVNATYNFLGLARTWYQASGFTIQGSTTTSSTTSSTTSTSTTTSTTSSTTTSTSTSTTTYIAIAVIIIIVVLVAAYLLRRRTK